MPLERLGKGPPLSIPAPRTSVPFVVFVTGNAGKLREVREILAQGTPIEIESRNLDRECVVSSLRTAAQSQPHPLFYDNRGFFKKSRIGRAILF